MPKPKHSYVDFAKLDDEKDPYIEHLEKIAKSDAASDPNYVKPVIGKTENHKKYLKAISEKSIIICAGPSGTAKTSLACGMAANLIKKENNGIDKIILTRPIVESGEKIGFLPGGADEKLHPYLVPLFEEFKNYISHSQLKTWQNSTPKIIEVIPLAHARGRNFHNSVIIVDEIQNCTIEQLKLILTRLGRNSKIILNGDVEQSDLPRFAQGGLSFLMDRLKYMDEVGVCEMTNVDIVRNPLIGKILDRLK